MCAALLDHRVWTLGMKGLYSIILLSFFGCSLWGADAKPRFFSPNGKYALRLGTPEDSMTPVNLVDAKSGNVILELNSLGHPFIDHISLLWAKDSQRLAFISSNRRGNITTIYARAGETFTEVELPETTGGPFIKSSPGAKIVGVSETALRWSKPNILVIESYEEDDEGNTIRTRRAYTFDAKNNITVTRVKR